MAERQAAQRRVSVLGDMEDWMARRNADVKRFGRDAEAAAHEALRVAARTGQAISAAKPSDVVKLGAQLLDQRKQATHSPSTPKDGAHGPGAGRSSMAKAYQVKDQVLAGARGAQDAFTFGLGDRAYAGVRAVDDAMHGRDLGRAYDSRMATERARDAYDAKHFAVARTVGQVAGTGAQILALGPAEGLVAGGVRIAEATPLIVREVATLGGAGAAAGVGGQGISDVSRGRLGTAGDYVGAGVGGAVGALEAALGGGVLGVAGGALGRGWSDKLLTKEKEALGEGFSRLRTWSRGDRTASGPKTREYLSGGGWTVPDQRTFRGQEARDIVESKFGRAANLSKRQRQAYQQPLSNYRVDHTLPRDVGAIVGYPLAIYGARAYRPPDDQ